MGGIGVELPLRAEEFADGPERSSGQEIAERSGDGYRDDVGEDDRPLEYLWYSPSS